MNVAGDMNGLPLSSSNAIKTADYQCCQCHHTDSYSTGKDVVAGNCTLTVGLHICAVFLVAPVLVNITASEYHLTILC